MLEGVRGLIALGAVLALPFLLRGQGAPTDDDAETVVIVTPNNEAIRYEFGRAFREHMRARGRRVRVDWRTPGGGNEISRYIASEYAASFEGYWTKHEGRPFTSYIAAAFANPAIAPTGDGPDPHLERLARATFLASDVGTGLDLLFGGGSIEFIPQAAAGRIVDAGVVRAHPEIFNDRVIPESMGGEPYWDAQGRWVGVCLSGFGICYNPGILGRVSASAPPVGFGDLAEPAYWGQIALADPSKSGSAVKSFEMIIQEQMNQRYIELTSSLTDPSLVALRAPREGWERGLRIIRRISANARYFTDAGSKIPFDISVGDAVAGACIDFFGRVQSEEATTTGQRRVVFVAPKGGTSMGADTIALLRGAPHRALAIEFIEFTLSPEGQKLWGFRVGTPGGPERYALRRLPILPALYSAAYASQRSDPEENPYRDVGAFTYRAAWTTHLYRPLAFVVRTMCVDTQDELSEAYRALADHGFPPQALALFDDISAVDYDTVSGAILRDLGSSNPIDEAVLGNRLVGTFRAQYREVTRLAKAGR